MAKPDPVARTRNERPGPTAQREPGELSEQALDLVTGGVGPELAAQNYAALQQLLSTSG